MVLVDQNPSRRSGGQKGSKIEVARMTHSHDKVLGNGEGWLSTRSRKKTCPPAKNKISITRGLPSFSFKLTQNSSASQQPNISQHQSSILNFVKKGQMHQERPNLGAVKKLFEEKDILSELQNKNTDFGPNAQKSTTGITNNDESKCQHFLQSADKRPLRLERVFPYGKLKEKDFNNHEKISFSKNDISSGINRIFSTKASYFSVNDCLSCFNKFESYENKLLNNAQKKTATKYIEPINQDLPGRQRYPTMADLKCMRCLDNNDAMTDLDANNQINASAICRHNSDSPPYKKRLVSCSSKDKILLRKQYLKRNMVNSVECMEQIFSNISCDKNNLFEEKAARDFAIHSGNSLEISSPKVSGNFQTDQIPGPSHSSNSFNSEYEEIIEDNASSNLPNPEEKPLTHSVNRYSFSEHNFESVTGSNTSHLSDDVLFENSVSQQEDIYEHLNFEEDNPEFTLQTQRSIDQEIPFEFMQETEDFTFNMDFTSEGTVWY